MSASELKVLCCEFPFPLSYSILAHRFTRQVRQLIEERTASNEAAASLENTNKLLEGSFVMYYDLPYNWLLAPAKLANVQSGHVVQPAHPQAQKKTHICCPKGSSLCLINEMGLAHDKDKYK